MADAKSKYSFLKPIMTEQELIEKIYSTLPSSSEKDNIYLNRKTHTLLEVKDDRIIGFCWNRDKVVEKMVKQTGVFGKNLLSCPLGKK